MSFSEPFIKRPIATSLLAAAILIFGLLAYFLLPVAPLPKVDFATINVNASLPGVDPETAATALAAPLEKRFGTIEMDTVVQRHRQKRAGGASKT